MPYKDLEKKREAGRKSSLKWRSLNPDRAREVAKKYRDQNPEKLRSKCRRFRTENPDYRRKQRYGHMEGFSRTEELRKDPNISCEACGSKGHGGNDWNTDHCHSTQVVRGVLCHSCNLALGLTKDSPEILRSLIAYLEKSRSPTSGTSAA